VNFDPHFFAALVGLLVSEFIPIVTKSRYGGILQAVAALLGRLYSSPGDIAGLSAQIVSLQAQMEKLRDQPTVSVPQTTSPANPQQG
jgi:hypothetical protein